MWDSDYIDMLYTDASVLLWQDMKTPQELLEDALDTSGLDWTEVGRRLGYKHPYQAIHALVKGKRKFTREKQARVAEVLGLPPDHFEAPDKTAMREAYIRRTLESFFGGPEGALVPVEDRKLMERIARQFVGDKLPTEFFFSHLALLLRGQYTTGQIEESIRKSVQYEEHNRQSPPKLPPRKR